MVLPSGGQTAYNFLMTIGNPGEAYDIGFNDWLTPVASVENIPIGVGVAKVIGQDYQVRLPHQDIVAVTENIPLVIANVLQITLNGIALAPVVWAGSNAATLAAAALLISAQPNIASAVSNGIDTITIQASQGFAVSVTFTVTAGPPMVFTNVFTNDNVFYGVAAFIQNKMNLFAPNVGSTGPSPYFVGDPVPVMDKGRIYVTTETTVTSDSPVYWRIIPTVPNPQVGSFRGDSDGGNAILLSNSIVRWVVGASAGGIAVLQINQP
jgi:hypothetical protein